MLKKLIFLLLISGIILSPKGTYAMDDEGRAPNASIARHYRLPVTVLPSGEVELPSGTKLPSTTTAAGALKAMTQKDRDLGQELTHKPLQSGTTYITVWPGGYFSSTKNGSSLPGFADLRTALERIEGSTQQPKPTLRQQPGAFSPYVSSPSSSPSSAPTLAPRPELEKAPSLTPTLPRPEAPRNSGPKSLMPLFAR